MNRSIDREELLTAPDYPRQRTCPVCGMPSANSHHVVPKGMGGTSGPEGPRMPLDGIGNTSGCHRLAHGHGLTFRYSETCGWSFIANDEAAADINKRRKRTGLPRIHGGQHACVPTPDFDAVDDPAAGDAPDSAAVGQELASIESDMDEMDGLTGNLAWIEGNRLVRVRELKAIGRGKRDAARAFVDWYTNVRHMSRSQVSKLEAFAQLSEASADLGVSKGYEVARAVADGLATEDEAASIARALSVSDLRATYWPPKDATETARIVCPLDGTDCPRKNKGESA